MPTKTFFNLREEKRHRIEIALIHEFGKGSFEQASITNIVNEAKIPRGSFYQYFEDKKDAIKYLIEKFILLDHKKIHESLIKSNGDIFQAAICIYNYRTEDNVLAFDIGLAKNILEELRKRNVNVFEKIDILRNKDNLIDYIDTTMLNIKSKKDLYYYIEIITAVTRSVTLEVFSGKISKEKGREILEKELEILKIGMKNK